MSQPQRYLTRARLRRDVPAAAIRALLLPSSPDARAAAGHRLVWTLFGDTPDRARDFLWREADDGVFYPLSERAPVDRHGLFDLDAPKPFAPQLAAGDRLHFSLRANATVARSDGPGQRGRRADVVMDAIKDVPAGERAAARAGAVQRAAGEWIARQGERCGFALPGDENDREARGGDLAVAPRPVRVLRYQTVRVARERNAPPARFGVLDLEGTLEVRDAARFTAALAQGFGRAKGFGCGLMLVRRARG